MPCSTSNNLVPLNTNLIYRNLFGLSNASLTFPQCHAFSATWSDCLARKSENASIRNKSIISLSLSLSHTLISFLCCSFILCLSLCLCLAVFPVAFPPYENSIDASDSIYAYSSSLSLPLSLSSSISLFCSPTKNSKNQITFSLAALWSEAPTVLIR